MILPLACATILYPVHTPILSLVYTRNQLFSLAVIHSFVIIFQLDSNFSRCTGSHNTRRMKRQTAIHKHFLLRISLSVNPTIRSYSNGDKRFFKMILQLIQNDIS